LFLLFLFEKAGFIMTLSGLEVQSILLRIAPENKQVLRGATLEEFVS
jgi:hypothetical protein